MSRDFLGVATGLAVLVMGVATVANLAEAPDQDALESPAPTIAAVAPSESSTSTDHALSDVGPAVAGVLRRSGNTETAGEADLAQLPPKVAIVLIRYGVPLRVPISPGSAE